MNQRTFSRHSDDENASDNPLSRRKKKKKYRGRGRGRGIILSHFIKGRIYMYKQYKNDV